MGGQTEDCAMDHTRVLLRTLTLRCNGKSSSGPSRKIRDTMGSRSIGMSETKCRDEAMFDRLLLGIDDRW